MAFTDTRPTVDPLVIFAGRTTSQGVLEAASGAPSERFRVQVATALAADPALAGDLAERRIDPYGAAAMLVDRAAG